MAQDSFRLTRPKAPPKGFTAVFNGKDLEGWWGAETEDPRKVYGDASRGIQKKHDTSLDDIRKHWRVENGELIK
jgi:hypothetical protein